MTVPSLDPKLIGDNFSPTPGAIYLNAASIGVNPKCCLDAVDHFNHRRHRPWEITLDEQFGSLHACRAECAGLIGASPEEISLAPNTSVGIHIAALTLPVPEGKIVLGHVADFPANVYPWMAARNRLGGVYEPFPLDQNGLVDETALIARLDQGDVAVLTVSWVSFITGQRLDLGRLGSACKARGIIFVVDAMQGLGGLKLDVDEYQIDVLSAGGHKWLLGPFGSGFFYIRRTLADQLTPITAGWLAMDDAESFVHLLRPNIVYANDGRKFEVATLGFQDYIGLTKSISLIRSLGVDRVHDYVTSLATRLLEGVKSMPHLTAVTPSSPAERAGVVSITAEPAHRPQVLERLDRIGAKYSLRGPTIIRFSPHLYNTVEETDRILEALGG